MLIWNIANDSHKPKRLMMLCEALVTPSGCLDARAPCGQLYSCVFVCVFVFRDRATAEQCLQHPWLQFSEPQETQTVEEVLPVKDQEASSSTSSSSSSPEPPSSTTTAEDEEEGEGPVTEELIVMAAYTLGQCRQSSTSTSEKEALAAEQKAISKRFKFEEPFSALQEVPGEFIY